jgi:hypothetical protein
MTAVNRSTVDIPTRSGFDIEAWFYQPEGQGPFPAVMMGHGLGAVKVCGLASFAERFCRKGSPPWSSIIADGAAQAGSTRATKLLAQTTTRRNPCSQPTWPIAHDRGADQAHSAAEAPPSAGQFARPRC